MRGLALGLVLLTASCGSKTSLDVDDLEGSPGGPPLTDTRCEDSGDIEPFTIATGVGRARAVAGDRVWFAELNFNAAVGWVGRDGGEPVRIRDEEPVVNGFVGERARAYWLTVGFGDTTGELRGWAAGGVSTLARGLFWPGSLHGAGEHFYFADGTNSGSLRDEMRGRVLRVRRGGGDVEVLAEALWLPTDIAVRRGFVYWVDSRRGELGRVPMEGGDPEILASGFGTPRHVVARERELFFGDGGVLYLLTPDDVSVASVADFSPDSIDGITIDDLGLFITLRDDAAHDRLVWVDWTFSTRELIEPGGRDALTDATRVYWTMTIPDATLIRAVCKARFR